MEMIHWKDIDASTPEGLRALDILTAKRAGFYVKYATLYTNTGTLLGGDVDAHIRQVELADNTTIWKHYTPRFTARLEEALWLWQGIEGLSIKTKATRPVAVVFEVYSYYGYMGYGDNHYAECLTLEQVALNVVVAWHKIMDCKTAHEADRAVKLARADACNQ